MTTLKESVARQFGATADAYKSSHVHARGADLARLVEGAALHAGLRVLDAGCGAGHTAAAAAPLVGAVVAVDLSPAMLEAAASLARERGLANVTFRPADVEALPFADAAFDVVLSRYSAHHWPSLPNALREIRRVLKPGGRLHLGDIVSEGAPLVDSYLQMIELLRDPSHVRDRSVAEWRGALYAAGFDVLEVEPFACPLGFDEWTARMATPPARAAVLRELMQQAPAEVTSALGIQPNADFTLAGAILRAQAASRGGREAQP